MRRGGGEYDHDEQDQQSRLFYELCALLFSIIRSSPETTQQSQPLTSTSTSSTTTTSSSSSSSSSMIRRTRTTPISPAAFASLLLGISLALMLCGSLTFMIGFILMPWVMGLLTLLYLFGILSTLSGFGRSFFGSNLSPPQPQPPPPPPSSRKGLSGEGFRCSVFGVFPIMPF